MKFQSFLKFRTGNLMLLVFAFIFTSNALAANKTATWTGLVSNNWSEPGNWNIVPVEATPLYPNNGEGGFTYDAVITTGIPTLSENISVDALNVSNARITGAFNLTSHITFTWGGNGVIENITLNANGGMELVGAFPKFIRTGGVVNNAGTANWSEGNFRLDGSGVLNNLASGTFNVTGAAGLLDLRGGAAKINNMGTFVHNTNAGNDTTVRGQFDNSGEVEVINNLIN